MSAVRRALPLWLVLVAAYAVVLVVPGGRDVSGPEAQRLLVAESIVRDRDIDVRNQHAARVWRRWTARRGSCARRWRSAAARFDL